MPQISNYTYDEITIGQTATYSKLIEERDVQLFAVVSGDVNPVHLDAAFAATTQFRERIAHGMLSGAVISAAIAMQLPGPGTIYLGQTLRFTLPVKVGALSLSISKSSTGKISAGLFSSTVTSSISMNSW
jgi:3-hydroxybutyryl-CoA dehydratase